MSEYRFSLNTILKMIIQRIPFIFTQHVLRRCQQILVCIERTEIHTDQVLPVSLIQAKPGLRILHAKCEIIRQFFEINFYKADLQFLSLKGYPGQWDRDTDMLGSSVQIDRADRRTVIRHIVRKEIIAASTHIRGVSAVDDIIEDSIYGVLTNAGLINAETSKMEFRTPPANESDTSKGTIVSSTKVGPSVAKTITKGAIISVLLALIAIFLYILLRFRNLAFSVGAIFALALDALAVIGFYSLLHTWVPMSLEIDQTFIGAILTVIGYSINDKVVVFDRIRENMGLYNKRDRKHLFNDSLNQTLARTINTSVTTLIVLLTIFFLGGDSIRSFAFAMILGVVFGTLSSIFIAAPTAYLTMSKKDRKEELEAVAEA